MSYYEILNNNSWENAICINAKMNLGFSSFLDYSYIMNESAESENILREINTY